MVPGLDSFREKFKNYTDYYTIIGGTACDILLSEADLPFRATKDIDMILIMKDNFPEFASIFWEYIKEGGYKCGWKNEQNMHFYRFTEGKFGYPTMIELFSRKPGYLLEIEEGIIPIHIDDDTSSLSAILLNDDYYKFMMSGRRVVDGIGVLGAEHLIPFKMYAWINLLERKRAGEHVNEKDLKKHKYDVCHVANCGITLQDGLFYEVIKQIILCFIEIEYQADCDNSAFQIIGTFSKYDVVHFFQREICADQESFDRVISLLFDGIDFDKFSRETIELYLDVFCSFVSRYFDAYQDNKLRELIEKKIKILETNILAINNPSVRIGLTQAVAMIDHKFYGDWSKCNTSYSEKDKRFLNQQYGKYGHHHFRSFLMTLYQMHIKELLPDILISVETVFSNCEKEKSWDYEKIICEHQSIVDKLILDAYVFHSDAIKKDEDLSNAYMHLLEMLIRLNSEKAAVLLDEFLIH